MGSTEVPGGAALCEGGSDAQGSNCCSQWRIWSHRFVGTPTYFKLHRPNQNFSEKQLKSRITKWGFDVKNIKADTMIELARTKAKRALLNKESAFRVNKRPVEDHKMERFLKRKDISEEELLAMPSPENGTLSQISLMYWYQTLIISNLALSPVFSVFTPPDTTGSPIPSAQFSALTVSLAEPKFEPLFSPMSPISHPVQNTLELLPNGILQPRHSLLPLRKTWHFNNAPKQNYERDADDPELRYDLYWSCVCVLI